MGMLSLVLATTLAAAPTSAPATGEDIADAASRAWLKQLAAELRNSDSARERALSTRMVDVGFEGGPGERSRRGKLLREAALAAPADRLVQSMWAEADEEDSGCDAAHPCPERKMALARLEPDNSAAWLPVLWRADRDHDDKARDAALAQVAKADHHDSLFAESVDAWMRAIERHPMSKSVRFRAEQQLRQLGLPPRRLPTLEAESSLAFAYPGQHVIPPAGLIRYCRDDASPAMANSVGLAGCRHLGELMVEGSSLLDRALGAALLRRFDERRALEVRRQVDWLAESTLPGPNGDDAAGRDDSAYLVDLRTTGSEIRAMELALQRRGIATTPPVGWQRHAPVSPPPAEER